MTVVLQMEPEPEKRKQAPKRQQARPVEEFVPTEHEVARAQGITNQYIERWFELFENPNVAAETAKSFRPREEQTIGSQLPDVSATIVAVAEQTRFYATQIGAIPCLELLTGDRPICSTREFFGSEGAAVRLTSDRYANYGNSGVLREAVQRFMRREDQPMMLKLSEAAESFRQGLSIFISHRIGGYRAGQHTNFAASGGAAVPGDVKNGFMYVRVECKSDGLRVHSSPAYFIDWTYFGAPSTPTVDGWLLPGRYIFSTDGDNPPEYVPDNGVFPIPVNFNPHTKRF